MRKLAVAAVVIAAGGVAAVCSETVRQRVQKVWGDASDGVTRLREQATGLVDMLRPADAWTMATQPTPSQADGAARNTGPFDNASKDAGAKVGGGDN